MGFYVPILGIFTGLYLLWLGLVMPENWKCFNGIMIKTAEEKNSLKATWRYLLKVMNKKTVSK